MKALNAYFVAVAFGLMVCHVQVSLAQNPYPDNVTQTLPAPPVGVIYHTDGHIPPQGWLLGKVYERVYGSPTDIREHTGEIYWEAIRSNNNQWDINWAEGWKVSNSTNEIRVPNGTTQGTMKAGTIYWLVATKDGAEYLGRGSVNHPSVPSSVEIWSYAQPTQFYPCPVHCHTIVGPHFNLTPGFLGLAFTNNIYLPPKSSVAVDSVHRGTKDLRIRFVNNINGIKQVQCEKFASAPNQLSTYKCDFNVDYDPNYSGFEALYDGCWHPVPRKLNPCTALCFEVSTNTLPAARVSLSVTQYGVSLQSCQVRVFDYTSGNLVTASPIVYNSATGKFDFTPPSGRQFVLEVKIGNENFYSSPVTPPTSSATITFPLPGLKTPDNGSYHAYGAAVPLSWRPYPLPGASAYILWIQQNGGNWQGYNLGSYLGANFSGLARGTYNWDIEVRNSSGQTIGVSEGRTFVVN